MWLQTLFGCRPAARPSLVAKCCPCLGASSLQSQDPLCPRPACNNWQAAHSVQTALLQGQSAAGHPDPAPGSVQVPRPQLQQQQGSPPLMTTDEGWTRV